MSVSPAGERSPEAVESGEEAVPQWAVQARNHPNTLAEMIAGQYVDFHQAIINAREEVAYITSMDETVRTELGSGNLSSASAAALQSAEVSIANLTAVIQQAVGMGQWTLWSPGTRIPTPELYRAFNEAAVTWQANLAAMQLKLQEVVQRQLASFDSYRLDVDRMRPGERSHLAPFVLPQSGYIGGELAAEAHDSGAGHTVFRWLMERAVLPDRPWGSLPWVDHGDTNLIFAPNGSSFPFAAALAATQGIVTDQISKSPPNQVKITWIDALQNGQSAGAFLSLAESGSRIIDGQVWCDADSIESALLRVLDRMAIIERVCLKDELENLEAYNNQPDVVPEAHHVVVVSGYPAGFRESSARLLRQISENSSRVGVSLIVVMDVAMAASFKLDDAIAPSYVHLADAPGLANGPAWCPTWWSPAILPRGELILGNADRTYVRIATLPRRESIWVPCQLREVDRAVQSSIINDYAQASRQLAESGLSPREMAVQQANPAARKISLRTAMIRWLHERELANQLPAGWDGFIGSASSQSDGVTFNLAEIAMQALYLLEQGYIAAGRETSDESGMSFPRLTSKGEDMAMAGGSTADDYAKNSGPRGASTTNNYTAPVFTGNDMKGAYLTWAGRDVNQAQSTVEQVTPSFEQLAEIATQILTQLPQFGLAAEDSEDALASAHEILDEVVQESPNRGRIRRSITVLRGILQPIASQTALGASEGSHDLAKAALEHLQKVVF